MLEDIISNYKRMCTRSGQFDIVLNTWMLLIVIFGIGGMIGVTVFIKLDFLPEIIRLYLLLLTIVVVEFIYLIIVQIYIFYRQKKYVIKKLTEINANNMQVIENMLEKNSKFEFQYIKGHYYIGTIYNKFKFENHNFISGY